MAIVGDIVEDKVVLQLSDLDRGSLVWAIYTAQNWDCTFHFIDDDTYLITTDQNDVPGTSKNACLGFSSEEENETRHRAVYGVVGSSWYLNIPRSRSTDWVYLIQSKASEADGHNFYHLWLTAYGSPNPCPPYGASSFDSKGWLTDINKNRILWVPHDSRRQHWGTRKTFVMAGARSGLITAMDFSNVQDIEMDDPVTLWTKHREKFVEYRKNLQEIPWQDVVRSSIYFVSRDGGLCILSLASR